MVRSLQDEKELREIASQIDRLQQLSPLYGMRIKVVKPAGTAGKPAQKRGYPRLIYQRGGSRAIDHAEVPGLQRRIQIGREILKLERRRSALEENQK